MRKILGILALSVLAACSQSATDTTAAAPAVDVSSNTTLQALPAATETAPVFAPSSFSKAVQVSKDGKFVRFDFDFFPDGRTVDFKGKSVSIPCTFLSRVPDGADAQLSAPTESPCSEPYRIDFNGAGEAVTLDGIVVPVDAAKEKFVDSFGFIVLIDSVEDSFDGSKIQQAGLGRLEDYYQAVLAKHPSSL